MESFRRRPLNPALSHPQCPGSDSPPPDHVIPAAHDPGARPERLCDRIGIGRFSSDEPIVAGDCVTSPRGAQSRPSASKLCRARGDTNPHTRSDESAASRAASPTPIKNANEVDRSRSARVQPAADQRRVACGAISCQARSTARAASMRANDQATSYGDTANTNHR